MTSLKGKVMLPDGVNKVFRYDDVKEAVEYLKQRLRDYWKHKLISRTSKDVNDLIDIAFHDVINEASDDFKNYMKSRSGGEIT